MSCRPTGSDLQRSCKHYCKHLLRRFMAPRKALIDSQSSIIALCFRMINDANKDRIKKNVFLFHFSFLPLPPSFMPLLMAFMRLLEREVFIMKTDLNKTPQQEGHRWTQKSWEKAVQCGEVQEGLPWKQAQGCVVLEARIRSTKKEMKSTTQGWLRDMNYIRDVMYLF